METNRIPEIRGASYLLDDVNEDKMKKLIEDKHIEECLIYVGGGKMLGIFPEGCGQDVCKEMEALVERETITAQSNFISMRYGIGELLAKEPEEYRKISEAMDIALEERQGMRWDHRVELTKDDVPDKEEEGQDGKNTYRLLSSEETEICESCRHRNESISTATCHWRCGGSGTRCSR